MRRRRNLIAVMHFVLIMYISIGYADEHASLAKEAIATFEQRKPNIPLLVKAAEAGNREAQFYLAETLRQLSAHITPAAQSWYEKSANQGDMYSMFRLSTMHQDLCAIMENCPVNSRPPTEWAEILLNVAKNKAQQGDGEGMEMMYVITGDLKWLKRSADAGYSSAQHWLAVRYERGDGWFFWPGQREKEIERLYEASAEGGYPRAIGQQAGILLTKGDVEGAQEWLMKGVSIGYIISVGNYAAVLQDGKYYNIKENSQLSYALYSLLSEVGGGAQNAANYSLKELELVLTAEQQQEAIQQAEAWKQSHPPLSYYPPKLEFW